MRKRLWYTLVFGCFVVGIAMLMLGVIAQPAPDYSYRAFYTSHHIPTPGCTLDGTKKRLDGVVLCAESGRLPDRAQVNVWEGYVLWNACYEYGDKYACAELED